MSVLNQVLRDVKQREAAEQAVPSEPAANSSPLVTPAKPERSYRKWLLLLTISLVLGAVGAWVAKQWRAEPVISAAEESTVLVAVETLPPTIKPEAPTVIVVAKPEPELAPQVKQKNEPKTEPKTESKIEPAPVAKPKPEPKPEPSKLQVTVEPPSAEELAREALSKGQRALQGGQLAQAEQFLLTALEHQPRWVLAHQVLAQVYAKEQRYDDALNQLAGISPPVGQHLDFYQLRGALAQQLQAYALAKRSYEALLAVDASQGRWWLGLALACDGLGATKQALQAYGHAMASRQLSAASAQYAQQRLDILQAK